MENVVFMINPRACSGWAARVWASLQDGSPGLRRARCIQADNRETACAALREALDDGVRRVVVVGGDGTVNAAAATILDSHAAADLGLVPVGSGSDTARGWHLPHKPKRALDYAMEGEARPMDVLRYDHPERAGWVVNIASVGISGSIADRVNTLSMRWRGTYLWHTLVSLSRFRASQWRIRLDGATWFEGPLLLCAAANGRVFARGMRIAPAAVADDGLADVVLVPGVAAARVLPWLPAVYTGHHVRAPFVRTARARRIRLEPLEPAPPLEVDGETVSPGMLELSVVPGALRAVRPGPWQGR